MRELVGGARGGDVLTGGGLLALAAFHVGFGLGAAAVVEQGAGGGGNVGHGLAFLHGVARLQGDALERAGDGGGDGVALFQPRFGFFGEGFLQGALRDGAGGGQLARLALGEKGQRADEAGG